MSASTSPTKPTVTVLDHFHPPQSDKVFVTVMVTLPDGRYSFATVGSFDSDWHQPNTECLIRELT